MKKSTVLERATAPDGAPVTLVEHDGRYSLRIGGVELMSTRQHASEERMAELACAHLRTKPGARVLIGGLGFGFTLRATLAAVAPDTEVLVAELLPCVIEWNRNPAYQLAAEPMGDRRVQILQRDVFDVLTRDQERFDAIMLDVDNGPAALTDAGNEKLYDDVGLMRVMSALRPDGCVVYWSASADPLFKKQLSKAGFDVHVEKARAHASGGGIHTLFVCRRRSGRRR